MYVWVLVVQLCTDPAMYHCNLKYFDYPTEQACVQVEQKYWAQGNGTAKCERLTK